MKKFDFNPFGDTESTYSPNAQFSPSPDNEKSSVPWGKIIALATVVVMFIVSVFYIMAFFYVREQRRVADESIAMFNDSIRAVHLSLSDPNVKGNLLRVAEDAEKSAPDGANNRKVKATRLIATLSDSIRNSPKPVFDESRSDEEMVVMVAPYFALCDLSYYSIPPPSMDISTMCEGFSTTSRAMMSSVRVYNSTSSSFLGVITGNTEHYADVMGKGNR